MTVAPQGAAQAGVAYPFELDPFQRRAIRPSTTDGRCWWPRRPGRARRSWPSTPWPGRSRPGRKAFYTTPIKALSNQKYADLVRRHGAGRVGLLTGDNAINGDAPVVVMTTEVLRNMIYAGALGARRAALRRARRGPLPPGRLPGPGVGGGDHPPAARGSAGVPVGHRVQRRGAGRVDRRRCGARRRRSSRSGGPSSCATSTWSATASSERPPPAADARRRPAQPGGRPARQRRPGGPRPAAGRPPAPAPVLHAPAARGRRHAGRAGHAARASTSSSAGRAATTPWRRAWTPACG